MGQKKSEHLVVIFLGVVLSYYTYLAVMNQLPSLYADYNGHTYVLLPAFTGSWLQGWKTVPYCLWHICVLVLNLLLHIPLEASAAYVTCFFQMSAYFIMYWMIRRYMESQGIAVSTVKAAVIAAGLSVVQALYIYWLDTGDRFLGTYSMNPLHNPTQIAVRPFILLSFCLVCDIRGAQRDKEGYRGIFFKVENGLTRYYIYLAVVLFLSSVAKPVFAQMFIPAVGLLMLLEWISHIRQKDGRAPACFKQCLLMLLCAVPTLLYILLQFLAFYLWGESYRGESSFILTKWMEVWSMYSENIILSIALGMAFPLFMVLIDVRFFLRGMGKLALTGYLVGILEAAVMGEGGDKLSHANFIWPMMCGMLLMWIMSTLRLLVLEKTQTDTKAKKLLVDFAWFLFSVHIICGFLYIKDCIYTI